MESVGATGGMGLFFEVVIFEILVTLCFGEGCSFIRGEAWHRQGHDYVLCAGVWRLLSGWCGILLMAARVVTDKG